MKKKKDITKEFIMQKMTEKWCTEHPELLKDIQELAVALTSFNMKWGTKLQPLDFIK